MLPCLGLFTLCFLQKLAVLKDNFQLDSGSQQELWGSSPSLANSELSMPPLYFDAGSQTDIPAEVSRQRRRTQLPYLLRIKHLQCMMRY